MVYEVYGKEGQGLLGRNLATSDKTLAVKNVAYLGAPGAHAWNEAAQSVGLMQARQPT
jgi:hypothetical protein